MPTTSLILYEGAEDKSFFKNLLKAHGIEDSFRLLHEDNEQYNGDGKNEFERLLKGLAGSSEMENHKSIIIVSDNDGDHGESFKKIKEQVIAAGYREPVNKRIPIITDNLPPLSILMIPWDTENGCLETLCFSAVNPKYNKELECADKFLQCMGADDWAVAKRAKLRMRSFLSAVCKSDPNTGLRYAWSEGRGTPTDIFDLKSPSFNELIGYLEGFV